MIKLILGAVIGVALYTSVAKADTQTVTPKEFVNTVASVPHKVSTQSLIHISEPTRRYAIS